MIRLLPLEQRDNYEAILELYFYMVAMVTPFFPEDIFPNGTFHERGDLQMPAHPITMFYQVTGKSSRRRTESYRALLERYNIVEESEASEQERREHDALLAKRIIKKAFKKVSPKRSLYSFLYKGLPWDDFHVHRDRLRCLLSAYMDTRSLRQAKLRFKSVSADNLGEVFRYTKFANLPEAVRLMDLLEVSVCPYCNRNFTTTVSSKGIRQGQYDHFHNKSHYPWFALSLRNLIPACGYCNHKKSDQTTPILYPYQEGVEQYYRFRTRPVKGIGYLTGMPASLDEFVVVGEIGPVPTTQSHMERIQNSLKIFHLEELYQTHQEHIAWIFRQRYIFPDTYLEDLCSEHFELFSSVQEARDMLYLRHLSPDRWGEHPLSKLTHDIDEEITELETRALKAVK